MVAWPIILTLLPFAAAAGLLSAIGSPVVRRAAVPAPLQIPASQYFEGDDGPWSSFNIRVGTPEQNVRVLVSTTSPETMVVMSQYGCSTEVFGTVPTGCANSRGLMFSPNASKTWNSQGNYYINGNGVGFEANLDYTQAANFALETVGLGISGVGPILKNQTVAGFYNPSPFYLGILGLSSQPVNYTTLGNFSAPSYFQTLLSQNLIPSLSWSYTAGAKYRLKQVYAQLIFGGYDTSRYTSNGVSFTMAGDISRDLVVAIQSISYSGTSQSTLLSQPIQAFIDSTDPNIWLPQGACTNFENAFGLSVDNKTGLYLVNTTHHDTLVSANPQVTFRISDSLQGGQTVDIVLPYSAFALQATYPKVQNTTYYFPLKVAANSTQYTLGRTFLQEAYLTADYERGNFSVSQCTWVEGAASNIVTILSKTAASGITTSTPSATSNSAASTGVSGGTIAGIAIGVIAAVVIILALWFLQRRRKQKSVTCVIEKAPAVIDPKADDYFDNTSPDTLAAELPTKTDDGTILTDTEIYQLNADGSLWASHELNGIPIAPVEIGGRGIIPPSTPEIDSISIDRPIYEMDGATRETSRHGTPLFPSPLVSPMPSRSTTPFPSPPVPLPSPLQR